MIRAFCLLLAAMAAPAADKPCEFWPGASYDPRLPTFRKVLGYEPGDRITSHEGIQRYLAALAAASPRIKVFDYGESWEGRKLSYAAVGSEANIKRLAEIRAAIERLADPRKTPAAEARKLMAMNPRLSGSGKVTAATIIAIVGLVLSVLGIIALVSRNS